jgi:hypothetical protein
MTAKRTGLGVSARSSASNAPENLQSTKPAINRGIIMEQKATAADKHTSAAKHHEAAAQHHRAAAKALEAGKPEQAATHAEVAHGHLAHATESAADVSKIQATKHDGAAKPS